MNNVNKLTKIIDKKELKKNEKILKKLYEKFLFIYDNTKVKVENLEFSKVKSSNHLKSGFCSPIIQDYINKNLKFVYKIRCFNSVIFYYSKYELSQILSNKEIIKRMGTICCIIGIMRKLFNDYNFFNFKLLRNRF